MGSVCPVESSSLLILFPTSKEYFYLLFDVSILCKHVAVVCRYSPNKRMDAFDALAHPFFDELRRPDTILPGNVTIPNMYNFTKDELVRMDARGLRDRSSFLQVE
jgi:hypothetical protein